MEALISCHVLHNILDARVGGENFVINRTGVSNPINHSSKIFRHKSEWYNLAFLVFYSLIQEFLNKSLVTERRIIDPTRSQIVPMVSEDNINQALSDKRSYIQGPVPPQDQEEAFLQGCWIPSCSGLGRLLL